jgi:hypothetical protein
VAVQRQMRQRVSEQRQLTEKRKRRHLSVNSRLVNDGV